MRIDHFQQVRELIWDVRAHYTYLGFALGLSPSDLSTIEKSNFFDVGKCFDAVLCQVLMDDLTQEGLARALESKTIKYGQLAKKVRAAKFSW